jgi:selenocysteine-specific elongation factor
VRLPRHSVRLTPSDEKLWTKIAPLLGTTERFRPPRVRDIAANVDVTEADVRRLLKLLGRLGKVDEVAPDHFFLRDTIAEMVEIATDVAANAEANQFGAAQFRDRLDNGRKVAIQILEFFDRHGLTLRRGDLRRINKQRLGLFRRPADDGVGNSGREASPVGRPDFKSGRGREPALGGFDSLSLPPRSNSAR